MNRRWPIRRWLGIALVLVFVIPVFTLVTTALLSFLAVGLPSSPLADTIVLLEDNTTRWNDSRWQENVSPTLAEEEARVQISINGDEVFSNADSHVEMDENRVIREIEVVNGTDTYRAIISVPTDDGPPQGIIPPLLIGTTITALALTLGAVAFLLRRNVIQPLETIGRATGELAAGNNSPNLTTSPIREVESVNQAIRELGARLNEIETQRQQLEQQRQYFIGAVAHDLRTPVFALRGSLDALQQPFGQSPEKREHYLGVARSRLDRLERLIADLFAYTQSELGSGATNGEVVEMRPYLGQIADGLEPTAHAAEVRLLLSVVPGDISVEIAPHPMERALENLITNAIRHSPAGGEVELSAILADSNVEISIRDHGNGFGNEDLEHALEPMYRGDSARSTPGAGLGMSIAANVVEAHGGTLVLSNHENGGAIVTVRLPLVDANQQLSRRST